MRLKYSQQGAAMVEFAIILPLFLVLTFGVIEFSLMLYDKALITNASREAARSGIAFRNPALTSAQLTAQTNSIMCNYLGKNSTSCPNGNNLLISFGNNTAATATAVYSPSYPPVSGTTNVLVTVNYTYNTLVIGALLNLLNNSSSSTLSAVPLSATSTMIAE